MHPGPLATMSSFEVRPWPLASMENPLSAHKLWLLGRVRKSQGRSRFPRPDLQPLQILSSEGLNPEVSQAN